MELQALQTGFPCRHYFPLHGQGHFLAEFASGAVAGVPPTPAPSERGNRGHPPADQAKQGNPLENRRVERSFGMIISCPGDGAASRFARFSDSFYFQ